LVNASGGVGGFTYAWGTIPVQTTTIATGLFGPSTYTVEVMDTNQCIKIDTISIPSPPVLSVSASSTGTICFGQADAIAIAVPTGGTPSYTFQWDANANNQMGNAANNLIAGIYFVTVTDYNGCNASTALNVGDAVPLDFEFETTLPTCFGEANGVVYVGINNGLPPYQYQWFDNSTLDSIPNLASGWYNVTATDGNGCIESDSIFLDQPDLLNVQVNTTDLSCFQSKDGQIYMIPIGGTPLYEYSIDGENFSNANIIYGLTAGSYPITIRDSFDCEANTFVTLFEPTELIVNAGEDLTIEQGDSIQLEAIASTDTSNLTFIWTEQFIRNSLSCDTCLTPFAKPLADLFYTITVVDSNGCVADDGLWVRVNTNRTVYVPNAFTPNGDQTNDIFQIHGIEGTQILQLRIYDRWGEKVFERANFSVNDPSFGWDGTFRGSEMNTGVFGWTIDVLFTDGETRQFSGNVTLIR
jgi:gliding motility-associated-like protein